MATDFWELAAQRDPLWAVLSDPAKRGRQWDLRAFFETGAREVSLLLYQLRRLGHSPATGRALDFGCGVGRLTQPLALMFDEAIGVDASPTMIDLGGV
jgi:2-polyprenyl-3-methyl-5-hydroxy-6-metoxy-1,4-benzoquinol methylase